MKYVYEMGMEEQGLGASCGAAAEWTQRDTLRWYGYISRTDGDRWWEKMFRNEISSTEEKGKPLSVWKRKMNYKAREQIEEMCNVV